MSDKNLELDETFFHDFECRLLKELPGLMHQNYYYPHQIKTGRDGLLVRVSPHSGQSWIGTFAFGDLSPKGKNGLYSWPDADMLCVVSQGQGYVVNVREPVNYEMLSVHPILEVIPARQKNIVVFANNTELIAYGNSGPAWVTERLSWDGIRVTKVSHDTIEGEVWDPRIESNVGFKVDLATGLHEGGVFQEI
ncbi:MAG: hypothetical protein QOF62_910 [Pyrinomonadaceae bacterium]|nr:hypothetical protein [Pyrinomonadaceae bacterium]